MPSDMDLRGDLMWELLGARVDSAMGEWITGGTSLLYSALVLLSTTKQPAMGWGVMLQIRPRWPWEHAQGWGRGTACPPHPAQPHGSRPARRAPRGQQGCEPAGRACQLCGDPPPLKSFLAPCSQSGEGGGMLLSPSEPPAWGS